jgi:hypothetical protein
MKTLLALVMLAGTAARATAGEMPAPSCQGPLAQRLHDAAVAAPAAARDDGTLYGMQRWEPTTGKSFLGVHFPGLLSCAYTVSAILQRACHPIGRRGAVREVAAALSGWRKITDPRDLQAGDVVFWRPVRGTILGFPCPGHWHVGVSLGGEATIDNDWWTGKPTSGSLDRTCTKFTYARRPPPDQR